MKSSEEFENAIRNKISHFDLGEYGDKLFFIDFLIYFMEFQNIIKKSENRRFPI